CRRVAIWYTSPSSPASSRARSDCSAGLYRSMCPTAPTSPAASNASASRWAPAVSEASGFSISVCTPASASANPVSVWNRVGAATRASSIPAAISACTSGSTASGPATWCGAPAGSATATRSTPSSWRSTRAWCRPIMPRPIRPALRLATSGTCLREIVDGGRDGLQVGLAQAGVHREGEHLACGLLGGRQLVRGGVSVERVQVVVRDRVVHTAADAACPQLVGEGVPLSTGRPGQADRVLVVHVRGTLPHDGG